ncbi:hypothetical protein EB093_05765 [bacterium]|nr:hypothetical protein [bacterium]
MSRFLSLLGLCFLIVAVPVVASPALIVSNYPEEISEPGILFSGPIPATSTRTMYYHVNRSPHDLTLRVLLQNNSNKPESIHITKGLGGPSSDGIYAGHRSAKLFWDGLQGIDTETVKVPPNSRLTILSHAFKPDMISTGIFELTTAHPESIKLVIGVMDSNFETTSFLNTPSTSYVCGTFFPAIKSLPVTYNFELPIKDISIGNEPFLTDNLKGIVLRGNYGMTYDITINCQNPSPFAREVNLLFSPAGGVTRGILMINKKVIETGLLGGTFNSVPEKIFSAMVPAKSSSTLSVQLFPQGGCFYPVNLVLYSPRLTENQTQAKGI